MKCNIFFSMFILLACSNKPQLSNVVIDLSNQKLHALPDSVLQRHDITHLFLGNGFTLYPPLSARGMDDAALGSHANKISSLPPQIAHLQNLRVLDLTANDLRSLPDEIASLNKLDTLGLAFNSQLNLANEYEKLKKLKGLTYLEIVGITFTQSDIKSLKKALPDTRIVASMEEFVNNIK